MKSTKPRLFIAFVSAGVGLLSAGGMFGPSDVALAIDALAIDALAIDALAIDALAIDLDVACDSSSPAAEAAANALDADSSIKYLKYLNFGQAGTGLIIEPDRFTTGGAAGRWACSRSSVEGDSDLRRRIP